MVLLVGINSGEFNVTRFPDRQSQTRGESSDSQLRVSSVSSRAVFQNHVRVTTAARRANSDSGQRKRDSDLIAQGFHQATRQHHFFATPPPGQRKQRHYPPAPGHSPQQN